MDDEIVLNIALDNHAPSKATTTKKSGRWTDRLKAKRVAKRKTRSEEIPSTHKDIPLTGDHEYRPVKRARRVTFATDAIPASKKRSSQIISSLFSYNPKIEAPTSHTQHVPSSLPSNAPLADSSTFNGLGLDPLISAHLNAKMKITKPTAIQRSALQALLPGSFRQSLERDVFIQAQTGSGKTLSFLLPIIHDLLPLSSLSYIDRSIGTLAIIIVPTRELAKQISDVLEALLQLRLRPEDDTTSDSTRLTRWLVSGLLSGGATRSHEKARLRKGIPILVSTPGRLLDHLQNTSSLNVGKCRWLVLDEADRLMDLGFEETITGIIQGLDGRRRLALQAIEAGKSTEVGGWDWDRGRRTILCSATIREDVQKLAGTTLINPLMVKAVDLDKPLMEPCPTHDRTTAIPIVAEKFTPPSQLSQKYVVVPLKLRLVALIALLRSLSQPQGRRGVKIVVFFSCTDSVDFHWRLLGGSTMDENDDNSSSESGDDGKSAPDSRPLRSEQIAVTCPLLPDTQVYRLHGSLPMATRLASLHTFSASPLVKGHLDSSSSASSSSSILFCTSVASRGLDLPLVRAVIQYDLPTEGGATEYVHRVGRTARAGKGGEAWSFVAPSETQWVERVERGMEGDQDGSLDEKQKQNITLTGVGMEDILKFGFGGKGTDYEERATEVQLSFERWVLRDKANVDCARKAFLSYLRAYSTHPSDEKHIFHIRHLHLGHLAKAFALRDAPTAVTSGGRKGVKPGPKAADERARNKNRSTAKSDYNNTAESRMQTAVRSQGRLTKKGGIMLSSGSSEFQIAGGSSLEKLVHGPRL